MTIEIFMTLPRRYTNILRVNILMKAKIVINLNKKSQTILSITQAFEKVLFHFKLRLIMKIIKCLLSAGIKTAK